MSQETKNVLMIFVIPFLFGMTTRFLFRKKKRGMVLTLLYAVIPIILRLLAEVGIFYFETFVFYSGIAAIVFLGSLLLELGILTKKYLLSRRLKEKT